MLKNKFISNLADSHYKIFVTADRSDMIDEAMQELGNENVIAFKDRSIHLSIESFKMLKQAESNKEKK